MLVGNVVVHIFPRTRSYLGHGWPRSPHLCTRSTQRRRPFPSDSGSFGLVSCCPAGFSLEESNIMLIKQSVRDAFVVSFVHTHTHTGTLSCTLVSRAGQLWNELLPRAVGCVSPFAGSLSWVLKILIYMKHPTHTYECAQPSLTSFRTGSVRSSVRPSDRFGLTWSLALEMK